MASNATAQPGELVLKLQILDGTGSERRVEARVDRAATVGELKALYFGTEMALGTRSRCVFLGRALTDTELLAQLPNGAVLQCYLQQTPSENTPTNFDSLGAGCLASWSLPCKWSHDVAFHALGAVLLAVAWGMYFAHNEAFDGFSKFSLRFFSLAWCVVCTGDVLRHMKPDGSREVESSREACRTSSPRDPSSREASRTSSPRDSSSREACRSPSPRDASSREACRSSSPRDSSSREACSSSSPRQSSSIEGCKSSSLRDSSLECSEPKSLGWAGPWASYVAQDPEFTVTLRLEDHMELGVIFADEPTALRVEAVRAEGGVAAWNRQCGSSNGSRRLLLPGDCIVAVNNAVGDPKQMSHEIKTNRFLTMRIARHEFSSELEEERLPNSRVSREVVVDKSAEAAKLHEVDIDKSAEMVRPYFTKPSVGPALQICPVQAVLESQDISEETLQIGKAMESSTARE